MIFAKSTSYADMRSVLAENGDKNFCVPLAMSIISGLDPVYVNDYLLRRSMRRKGRGVYRDNWYRACGDLGIVLKDVTADFPKARTIRTAQRYLPVNRRYVIVQRSHVTAMIEGEVRDWAEGRCKRVQEILEVVAAPDGFTAPTVSQWALVTEPVKTLSNKNGWADETVAAARKKRYGCKVARYDMGTGITEKEIEFSSVRKAFAALGLPDKDHQAFRAALRDTDTAEYTDFVYTYIFTKVEKS
jgi:hypothetical protein